jgi:small conductance mechanosensitive channel
MHLVFTALITDVIDSSFLELLNLQSIKGGILSYGLVFLKTIVLTILYVFIGKKLIKFILKVLDKYFSRSSLEISVTGFLLTFIKAVLYILLITIIIVEVIGIQSSTVIALLGSAGLSIGLALQGGLSNFAGGVLILLLRPFRVGDYIISEGYEGTVTAIDIFYTKLLTFDNKLLVMPNGTLSNSNIINVTNEPNRRLDVLIPISYDEDINLVKGLLKDIIMSSDMVLKEHAIDVFVSQFEQSALQIGIRVWVLKENYWILKWELLEKIKNVFDANKISLQINQMDVNIKQ